MPVGTISYATASVAFAFLLLLLVASWRGRIQGVLLAMACLVSTVWAGVAALQSTQGTVGVATEILEVLRNAVWFLFLVVLLGYSRSSPQAARVSSLKPFLIALPLLLVLTLATIAWQGGLQHDRPDSLAVLPWIGNAVAGLLLVEQLLRNAHPQQRWGIKYLCLGLGGMFAYDFYLYADALLFRFVNPINFYARGVVNAFVVPLIAVSAARNPRWSLDVSVSRRALFHSATFLGAGLYLVLMAAAGYYVRAFEGQWGPVLQMSFLFGAGLLLVVVMFSGTLRSQAKVFLSKHFFSYRYDYREEWLRFTRTLSDGEAGQLRERSIQAIAELVESPGGALWLAKETGELEPAAHWNIPMEGQLVEPDTPLCRFLEARQWVVSLDEFQNDPQAYEGLEFPEWLRAMPEAWVIVPLILRERLVGFVVLARSRGRIKLDWETCDLLKTAGRQAASYLAQLEAAKALLTARQFESFNRMSAFVVHDLKNLIAQMSLLLANAEKHKHKPAFQEDMLETVSYAADKMKRLLFQVRGGYALEPPAPVSLDDLARQVVASKAGFEPSPTLELQDAGLVARAHRARLERVLANLLQNAIEATPADGRVTVRLLKKDGVAVVEVTDTGHGMSEQFIRYRLFKPFETTKSAGMGIGTYEASEYLRELGGRIEVESREGAGTTFRLVLPQPVQGEQAHEAVSAEG